jgi:HK97 family phage portal protein
MICDKCQRNLPSLFGVLTVPHRCNGVTPQLKASPLSDLVITPAMEAAGAGPEWANPAYGEYYAKDVSIYAAIKIRSEALLRPPMRVLSKSGDDWDEVDQSHPVRQLMQKVNPWWTHSDLLRGTSTYLDLWGSAFWVLTKSGRNSLPNEIWLHRPDRMRIRPDKNGYISHYEFQSTSRGGPRRLETDEVIWFRHFNPLDEYAGLSPIAPLRLSLDTATDAMNHNRNVFKNGVLTDTFISLEQSPVDEEIQGFYQRLKARYGGVAGSHRPMILGGVRDVKNLGLSSRDMEYLAQLRWSLEDVSRVYGVPKPLLADLERATYSNIRQAELLFWRNTMAPYCMFLQEEMTELLLPQFEEFLGQELKIEFDLGQVEALQRDELEVQDGERKDISSGVLTINEVRERRNLPAVPWGDVYWASAAFVPIEDSEVDPLPAPTPMPEPEGDDIPDDDSDLLSDEPLDEELAAFFPRTKDSYKKYNRSQSLQVDASYYEVIQKRYETRLNSWSKKFENLQEQLFNSQLRETLRRVRNAKSLEAVTSNGHIETRQVPDEAIFNADEWTDMFNRRGRPLMQAALVDSANAQIAQFNLGFAFDVRSPVVQSWVDERTATWTALTNSETAKLLTQEIEAGIVAGETTDQVSERVGKVFNFNNTVRSERIARTEITSALNEGAVASYQQSNVVEKKRWVSTFDDRSRDDHVAANGQEVPLEGRFTVGGEQISHPGDGSAANSVNCRCTVAPVVKRSRRE